MLLFCSWLNTLSMHTSSLKSTTISLLQILFSRHWGYNFFLSECLMRWLMRERELSNNNVFSVQFYLFYICDSVYLKSFFFLPLEHAQRWDLLESLATRTFRINPGYFGLKKKKMTIHGPPHSRGDPQIVQGFTKKKSLFMNFKDWILSFW